MEQTFWNKIKEIASAVPICNGTFKVWKHRNAVPPKWHRDLIQKAKELDLSLTYDELINPPSEAAK